ncbi:sugar transferase [Pseudooctadecabacter jejudonensis]|uniref:Putative undecaprenyl-phosphate N-acetylgalactosaminyl 1-phosphate transferase n=1 Tax=Pseudooctadecabacter jejudonensis TaxID=1391910 RepID=A0A1Y5SQ05_9RHOB|nr:sugar transferase [Pseudooctadecabacter jejudonensis]SLN45751.1 Putative undecaprenyl-phosphate N-acetylgalactosaminyl 1-phosphate transferase [Pseudooctadecabacter jejudonensis]
MLDSSPFDLKAFDAHVRATRARTLQVLQRSAPGGFVPVYPRFHAAYNRMIGLVLFLAALPLLVVLTVLVLVIQGRPIFYAGPRLGKDQVSFNIFKFRTLDTAKAKALTADKVLPRNSNIETRMGKFLRGSRLDELPQLWNIVRGDMNIVGPRPVRPELARTEQMLNLHYNIRFAVVPGLIGPTQAYLCHGTSKRIRARYNYGLCSRRVSYIREIALFTRVGWAVLSTTGRLVMKKLRPNQAAADSAQTAQLWNLRLKTAGGQVLPALAFEGMKIGLPHGQNITAGILLIDQAKGLRKANVVLRRLSAPDGDLTHQVVPADEVAVHLVGRYLMKDAVVQPVQPRPRPEHDVAILRGKRPILRPEQTVIS